MCILKNYFVLMNITQVNSVLHRTEKITTKSTRAIYNFRNKILFKIRNREKRKLKKKQQLKVKCFKMLLLEDMLSEIHVPYK